MTFQSGKLIFNTEKTSTGFYNLTANSGLVLYGTIYAWWLFDRVGILNVLLGCKYIFWDCFWRLLVKLGCFSPYIRLWHFFSAGSNSKLVNEMYWKVNCLNTKKNGQQNYGYIKGYNVITQIREISYTIHYILYLNAVSAMGMWQVLLTSRTVHWFSFLLLRSFTFWQFWPF